MAEPLERLEKILERMLDLVRCKAVYPKCAGTAISFACRELLDDTPTPNVANTPDCGVQFEWYWSEPTIMEFEIEFCPDGTINGVFSDVKKQVSYEIHSIEEARKVIAALSAGEGGGDDE